MKNLMTFFVLSIMLLPAVIQAQDRPKNIGVSDIDTFKNNSFDIKDESATLKESVTTIDNEIKGYSGIMNTIGVDKLRNNLKALTEGKSSIKVLTEKIAGLNKDSKAVLETAKNVKPKFKSISATKNTNASVKGLGVAQDDLKTVGEILDTDIKLIKDELKARGEPIE